MKLSNFSKLGVAALLLASVGFMFSLSAKESGQIEVLGGKSIQICSAGNCTSIAPSGKLSDAMENGYEVLSSDDVLRNGVSEVVATTEGENECSRFFIYDENSKLFNELKFSDRDICAYKVSGYNLISTYKDGGKLNQDIYIKDGDVYRLLMTDSCVGCDEVERVVYSASIAGSIRSEFLVSNYPSFEARKPLNASVVTEKAWLYSSFIESSKTKMYLVKGDHVDLIKFNGDDVLWYLVDYHENDGKKIRKWIKCSDLNICHEK